MNTTSRRISLAALSTLIFTGTAGTAAAQTEPKVSFDWTHGDSFDASALATATL